GLDRPAAAGTDDDVELVVLVGVDNGDADAVAIGRAAAGEEVGDRRGDGEGRALLDQFFAADNEDAGPAVGAGAEDEVAVAVAGHVAEGAGAAVAQGGVEDEEIADEAIGRVEAVGGEGFGTVDDFDAGPAAETGDDDEIGNAVAIDIAGSHAGAAPEVRVEGQ